MRPGAFVADASFAHFAVRNSCVVAGALEHSWCLYAFRHYRDSPSSKTSRGPSLPSLTYDTVPVLQAPVLRWFDVLRLSKQSPRERDVDLGGKERSIQQVKISASSVPSSVCPLLLSIFWTCWISGSETTAYKSPKTPREGATLAGSLDDGRQTNGRSFQW